MNLRRFSFASASFGILSAACITLLSSGCLISGDSHQTRTGTYVSDNTFNQIKPGQTSEDWVRATLGPATSDKPLPEDGRILKWSYTERKESSGAVFLIFGGHDSKETTHTAYVETHRGMVTNAWRE